MTKFKKIISSFLAIGLISGCLQSMAFADGLPTVTWKETQNSDGSQLADAVGYDPATGTFSGGNRVISDDSTSSNHQFYLGVEFSEKVETGTVIVEAEFSNMNVAVNSDLNLFDLSNEDNGWKGKAKSGLKIQKSDILINNSSRTSAVNGVHRLKFVAVRANTDADWSVEVYHFDDSEPIHTYTVSKTDLPDIKYITNNSWVAGGRSIALTVNKFKVKVFPEGYGTDFSATYVDDDTDDYTDRTVRIDVSNVDTPIADITAVDAYIVNEETDEKTSLDSSNVSYENGVAQITVPTSFYGILSIDLVLKTEGGDFTLNVPLTGNPFENEYIGNLVLKEISTGATDETVKVKPDFDEVVLKFNNYINPDTLGAVTFTGDGVDNLQKDLSDNGKTLTISFDPLIDKETYTLTIGTGLKSTNDKSLEEEITYIYQVDSDLTKLNITSHNTETVYILLPNAKKLEVEFNFDLDPATVASGIQFTKADGTAIPGGYNVEMGNSSRQAIITFGRLRQGEYKLVTTSSLKAQEDGITTKEDEWRFKVETDDDEPIVDGEFSDFEEGVISDKSDLEGDNITYGDSTYEIVTSESGTKYLTSTGTQAVKGGSIAITLPQPVNKGKIAFDFSFKAIGGSIKRNLFTAKDSSNNKVYSLQVSDSNTISKNGASATLNGEFTQNEYTVDADGFYNLRIVYMAEDEFSDWTIQVYDKLTSMADPIWQGKAGRVYDSANKKYGIPNISQMVLFDIWWSSGNDQTGAGVAVKEYAYHILPVPQVTSSNLDAAEPDTDDLELTIDSDLNVNELSEETVTLIAGEREIPAVVGYSAQDRKLTITPKEYLEYGTTYQIKFGNMICENESFTTPQRPVSMSTAPVLAESGGVKSVQISATHNTGAPATICAIAKVFDAEGNLIKIIGDDSLSLNDELPLAGVTWQAGYKVQTFIWASQNGLIYPISAPVELPIN